MAGVGLQCVANGLCAQKIRREPLTRVDRVVISRSDEYSFATAAHRPIRLSGTYEE